LIIDLSAVRLYLLTQRGKHVREWSVGCLDQNLFDGIQTEFTIVPIENLHETIRD